MSYKSRRSKRQWCSMPHAIYGKHYSATKDGLIVSISSLLHHLGSHGVPAVAAKWRQADRRFRKIHNPPWCLVSRGILTERF